MTKTVAAAVLVLTLVGATVAGCAKRGDNTGGSGDSLPAGRTFLSTSIKANGLDVPWAPDSRVSLSFTDTAVNGTGGCNHLGGQATLVSGRLRVTDIATTDMACPEPRMTQDQWVADLLASGPAFVLDGDTLTLTAADGKELIMLDRKVVDPDRPLTGVRWEIDTLVDGDVASSMPVGVTAFLQFDAEQTFTGNDGCNAIMGSFSAVNGRLKFSTITGTKMACDDARGQVSTSVRAVLNGPIHYTIEANRLTMTGDDGHGLAAMAA